uniref:BTB domain-containing protein n=1 Tax=Romanomermis culicivorax TaxID=13658 RepID=A0A915JXR5_ROMCU
MNNLPPVNNNNNVPVCVSNNSNLLLHVNADFAPTNSATSSMNAANVVSINPLLTSSASSSSLLNNLTSGGCPVFPAAQMNASQTEIKVERVTHHWTVKNFSHCYQEYLENFVTLAKNDETLTWSVKIYPKGNGENNKEFVFLCLNRMVPGSTKFGKVGFKSRFILRNSENKEIEMRVHPNPSHSDYVSYIKRDILFPQISPKDVIVVTVEIDVAVETITTVNTEDAFSVPDPKVQLMNDYEKLFKSQQFCDFVIEVGNRRINAHRCILGMRSTVFNAMLSHDTEESQKVIFKTTTNNEDLL